MGTRSFVLRCVQAIYVVIRATREVILCKISCSHDLDEMWMRTTARVCRLQEVRALQRAHLEGDLARGLVLPPPAHHKLRGRRPRQRNAAPVLVLDEDDFGAGGVAARIAAASRLVNNKTRGGVNMRSFQ